jgi:hypothetical protein
MRVSFTFTLSALAAIAFVHAAPLHNNKRNTEFFAPKDGGGSQLGSFVAGQPGEPMNIIISGLSDPEVLTDKGFENYAKSLGFSIECLDQHKGGPMQADLGDGNGRVDQTVELREDFGVSFLGIGTCLESLNGGNHFRMWRQNGPKANSGALFLAASTEKNVQDHHDIEDDGYNKGRDLIVKAATANNGETSHDGIKYQTTSKTVSDLLPAGADGVNHGVAQDGSVTVLTVTIKDKAPLADLRKLLPFKI